MGIKKTAAIILWVLPAMAGSLRETVASQPGFELFYNLQYDQALAAFTEQAAKDPTSPDVYNHIAQTVLYREMYRAGMLSSDFIGGTKFVRQPKLELTEAQESQFHEALNRAMSVAQEKLAADPRDTRALYSMGVSYGLRGNYQFVVKKAWLDALRDATSSRKMHKRVTELDPEFIDAKLTQGVNDYIVGSLPLHWKVFGFLAGFRGDKQRGIRTLMEVAEHGRMNRVDAMIILSALYMREKRPAEAVPVLMELVEAFPQNPLLKVELEKAQTAAKEI